jgi:hypothetical protein
MGICVLIRRLNSSCSCSIALVVRSDAILGVARLRQINEGESLNSRPQFAPLVLWHEATRRALNHFGWFVHRFSHAIFPLAGVAMT